MSIGDGELPAFHTDLVSKNLSLLRSWAVHEPPLRGWRHVRGRRLSVRHGLHLRYGTGCMPEYAWRAG